MITYFGAYFEFETNKYIIIGLIYKPPNTSVKQFNEKFENLLSLIQIEKNHAYLFGDFNICSKNELTEADLEIKTVICKYMTLQLYII